VTRPTHSTFRTMGHARAPPASHALSGTCERLPRLNKPAKTTKPLQSSTPSSSVVRKGDLSCRILDNSIVAFHTKAPANRLVYNDVPVDHPHREPHRPKNDNGSTLGGGAHGANGETSDLAPFAREEATQSNIHLSTRLPFSISISYRVTVRLRWRPRILSAHGGQGSAMSATPPRPQRGQARHRPSIGMMVS
jgi:hypothetical protein